MTTLARLKVNSIKVDPNCPSTNKQPERGHRIVIDMSAEVLAIGEGDDAVPYLNTATWKVIGPDGTAENATPIDWECYPAEDQIDGQINNPGQACWCGGPGLQVRRGSRGPHGGLPEFERGLGMGVPFTLTPALNTIDAEWAI